MRPDLRDLAQGKWRSILPALGLSETFLSGKHGPCPVCGGKDRFRFDDLDGRGTFYCNNCGAGDGITLALKITDRDFKSLAGEIEQLVGTIPAAASRQVFTEEQKIQSLRRVWNESQPLQPGDQVMGYLAARGLKLADSPIVLRLHPSLPYYEGRALQGRFPAMVAVVTDVHAKGLTLHRTYLQGNAKAPVTEPKKLMPGKPLPGGAIQLFPKEPHLGVAEGIETALAAHQLFGIPVWACVSATLLESFKVPEGVQRITIFADHDESFAGQRAAATLAARLAKTHAVEIKMPEAPGDWLDVLNHGKRSAGGIRNG